MKPIFKIKLFLLALGTFFACFGLANSASAKPKAINVYYSVGQSASNLMTGTPTMNMTSGAAVLSVAQTGNIGVGDRVTYNTSSVAYIASKTDSTGLDWQLVTALGAKPTDVSGATVNSITHEYTSLSAAIAGASNSSHINNTDLTAANVVLNIPCYYDSGPDTTAVTVSGYTTSDTSYIKIYTPFNTTTYPAEANFSQRHQGKYDLGKYRLEYASGYNAINDYVNYITIDGLQIKVSDKGDASSVYNGLNFGNVDTGSGGNIIVSNNIIAGNPTSSGGAAAGAGISMYNALAYPNFEVYNNIVYGFEKSNVTGPNMGTCFYFDSSNTYAYNNTAYNCGTGFSRNTGTLIAKNNIAQNTAYKGFNGTFNASSTNNISSDATAPGSNAQNSKTITFANAAANDFHLSLTDTAALGKGVNLSADSNFAFKTDIDGDTRGAIWSIGADNGGQATVNSEQGTVNNNATAGLSNGLVGYWSFNGDDISGTTVKDLSGQNNNGTNSSATPTLGARGQALSFNGTSNFFQTGNIAFPASCAYSISFWMKSNSAVSGFVGPLNWGLYRGFEFYTGSGTHHLSFMGDGSWWDGAKSTSNLDDSKWHYIVGTNSTDGTCNNNNLILYVDGVQQGTSVSNTTTNNDPQGINSSYFPGMIDEVRVYNRALSATEIGDLYRAGNATMK